jgi:plastocyanin
MKKIVILLFSFLVSSNITFGKIWDIEISNYAFNPSEITINIGDIVRWTNKDGASHTATADNSSFNSGYLSTNSTFQFTFTLTGTYNYHCMLHPYMTGMIIVTAPTGIKIDNSEKKFQLLQNFPNPFNPVTTIGYTLPSKDQVRIFIYSIIGNEIGKIKDEVQEMGYHEIQFDASNLSSGIYIYKIEFGETNIIAQSKKFILQK